MDNAIPHCLKAEELESALGDPSDPEVTFSFRRAVELDEEEAFPAEACRLLDDWKLPEYFIPASAGGKWRSTEELLLLQRLIARRDLTVAIGHGKTFLGALGVWIGGDAAQKAELSQLIRCNGAVSLALTERAHGSDLVASDVTAHAESGGTYRLTGEKWIINNATRGTALSVISRVSAEGESDRLALLFVNKEKLARGSYTHLPKVLTHGIRGADISGIRFDGCQIGKDAILGDAGAGLDTTLKLLQITRIACAALSLGAVDTALRVTLDFASERKLYGTTMLELPYARHLIVCAFADAVIAECVTTTAARTVHVAPAQLRVTSAVAKYFVPTVIEGAIRTLSVALGARHYLRSEQSHGIFQKLMRDNEVVSLFDGSTVVTLDSLASLLPRLAVLRKSATPDDDVLDALFTPGRSLPPLDLGRVTLATEGSEVVAALGPSALHLAYLKGRSGLDGDLHAAACALAKAFSAELQKDEAVLLGPRTPERHKSPQVFEYAKRYCVYFAASACIQTWLRSREKRSGFVARPEWLVLVLARLLASLRPLGEIAVPATATDVVYAEMLRLHAGGMLFSLLPIKLATRGGRPA
jgi:alkylation response protein AidB-like acyl-CoA dehydrogenase